MDKLPILLSLVLACVSGLLFALDLRGYFNPAEAAIAWVADASGTIRKLSREEFTWDRAQKGTSFASKDTVATGEDASARIYFKDGADVQLEPASMLVIDTRADELILSFISGGGKVRVARNSARRVVAARVRPVKLAGALPGAIPTAAPAETIAQAVGTGPNAQTALTPEVTNHEIPEARISVETIDELPANPEPVAPVLSRPLAAAPVPESILRNPEAVAKLREEITRIETLPPSPALVSPDEGARVELAGRAEVMLSWKPQAEAPRQYEISLRPVREGQGPKVFLSKEPSFKLKSLEPGRYVWTVRAMGASLRGSAAPPRWFEVFRKAEVAQVAAPPAPVVPKTAKPVQVTRPKAPARSAVENKKVNLLPVSVE